MLAKPRVLKLLSHTRSLGTLPFNRVPISSRLRTLRKLNRAQAYSNTSHLSVTYGVSNCPEILNHVERSSWLDEGGESDYIFCMKSAVLWQSFDNNLCITCRIATREYTEEFTEVELPIDQVQIASLQPSGLRPDPDQG